MDVAKSIVFITLFLGVTAGVQRVEVAVDAGVAAVELRLDGAELQRLGGPPWVAEMDLGRELAPHRLEALAFDADGAEVGRAEQWINLPRQRQEVRLLLERDGGRVTGGRLAWGSVEFDAPASLRLSFDGQEIAAAGPTSFVLPRHAAGELHVVSAQAAFPDGGTARADAVFGGRYGEETRTELTAVPVIAEGRLPRRAGRADGWLAVDGKPARVAAIERGDADLFAVVDTGLHDHLDALAYALQGRGVASGAGLRDGDRLFLVNPRVEKRVTTYDLFGLSTPLDKRHGGSAWLLATRRFPVTTPERPQRLADAVATAALEAAAAGRPRAVLLLLGPDAADHSGHPPAIVRRFLDRLRVPLAVWYVEQTAHVIQQARQTAEREAAEKRKLVPPGVRIDAEPVDEAAIRAARRQRLEAARELWGEVTDVPDVDSWVDACSRLRTAVARQRVLWIEGAHPPGAVALGEAPDGVRLVGVGDVAPEVR